MLARIIMKLLVNEVRGCREEPKCENCRLRHGAICEVFKTKISLGDGCKHFY